MFRMIFYITFLPFAIGFEQINRCDVTSGMQLRRECRLLSVSTAVFINVTLSVLGSLQFCDRNVSDFFYLPRPVTCGGKLLAFQK